MDSATTEPPSGDDTPLAKTGPDSLMFMGTSAGILLAGAVLLTARRRSE